MATHYTFSNPATGFPFVLRERSGSLTVERSISMAIEFVRDVADARRLSDVVRACRSMVAAAELLYQEHGCDDIEAGDGRVWSRENDDPQREIECSRCLDVIATCQPIGDTFTCNRCLGKDE